MSIIRKVPLARSLAQTIDDRIRHWIAQEGKAMPATVVAPLGGTVIVSFDILGLDLPLVQMPLAGAEFIRYPIQTGASGVCFPADYSIGSVSGLGAGPATTRKPGNLSALTFFPVGSVDWIPCNPEALVMYGGIDGVSVQSEAGLTPAFSVSVTSAGITLYAGATAMLTVTAAGVTIQGQEYLAHEHLAGTLVAPSSGGPVTGDTGTVVPA